MYKEYLKNPCTLDIETASCAYMQITGVVKLRNDEILSECYQDFLVFCNRYARIRAEWNTLSREEKIRQDSARTLAHDRVIDTCNILYRYMQKLNLNTAWYNMLGIVEADKMTRKKLGDFACYVSLFLGLEAR